MSTTPTISKLARRAYRVCLPCIITVPLVLFVVSLLESQRVQAGQATALMLEAEGYFGGPGSIRIVKDAAPTNGTAIILPNGVAPAAAMANSRPLSL